MVTRPIYYSVPTCVCVCVVGDKVSPEECKKVAQAYSDALRHWRKRKRMASTHVYCIAGNIFNNEDSLWGENS